MNTDSFKDGLDDGRWGVGGGGVGTNVSCQLNFWPFVSCQLNDY